tara:strand:+ start:1046 stop:1300 length:255 start_codon:yes stop_codon:yes gene_type:complete
MYDRGDLVELARFGYAPQDDKDRVFGTVVEALEPQDHFVPRYQIRLCPQPNQLKVDEFSSTQHERLITVMEYDIAGKTREDSQA